MSGTLEALTEILIKSKSMGASVFDSNCEFDAIELELRV